MPSDSNTLTNSLTAEYADQWIKLFQALKEGKQILLTTLYGQIPVYCLYPQHPPSQYTIVEKPRLHEVTYKFALFRADKTQWYNSVPEVTWKHTEVNKNFVAWVSEPITLSHPALSPNIYLAGM